MLPRISCEDRSKRSGLATFYRAEDILQPFKITSGKEAGGLQLDR